MEILALSLVIGIWLAHEDRKTHALLFPPSTCIDCGGPIKHKPKRGYYHADDHKEYRSRINVLGQTITHSALPVAEPWEIDDDQARSR